MQYEYRMPPLVERLRAETEMTKHLFTEYQRQFAHTDIQTAEVHMRMEAFVIETDKLSEDTRPKIYKKLVCAFVARYQRFVAERVALYQRMRDGLRWYAADFSQESLLDWEQEHDDV